MEENNGNKEGNTYLSKEEKLNRLFLLVSIMILTHTTLKLQSFTCFCYFYW